MRSTATEVGVRSDNPGRIPGMMIDTDRPCPQCGYNVRGLAVGKPCPECGRPIFFGLQTRPEHALADCPYGFIRLQSLGLWAVFAGAFLAAGVAAFWAPLGILVQPALAIVATVWVGGLALLCLSRPSSRAEGVRVEQESSMLRLGVVVSQSLWLVAAGLATLGAQAPFAGDAALIVALVAALGVLPTMMFLSRYAGFVGDRDRGSRLACITVVLLVSVALWAMGLRLRVSIPLPSLSLFLKGVPLLAWVIVLTALFTLWHFFQLAVAGSWAIQLARRQDEQVQRLRERLAEDRTEAAKSAHENEPFGGPVQAPLGSLMGIKPKRPG